MKMSKNKEEFLLDLLSLPKNREFVEASMQSIKENLFVPLIRVINEKRVSLDPKNCYLKQILYPFVDSSESRIIFFQKPYCTKDVNDLLGLYPKEDLDNQ